MGFDTINPVIYKQELISYRIMTKISKVKSTQKSKAVGSKSKDAQKKKVIMTKRAMKKAATKSSPAQKSPAPVKPTSPVSMKKVPSPVKVTMSPPTVTIPPPPSLMNSFRMPSPAKVVTIVRSASKSPRKKVDSLSPKKNVTAVAREFVAKAEPAKKRWYGHLLCSSHYPSFSMLITYIVPLFSLFPPLFQVLPVAGLNPL